MTNDELLGELNRKLDELLARPAPLDLDRAYSDREVCALLGGISSTTLWRIRRKGLLETITLFDDDSQGKVQRTTGRQIAEYLKGREPGDVLAFTGTGRRRKDRAA